MCCRSHVYPLSFWLAIRVPSVSLEPPSSPPRSNNCRDTCTHVHIHIIIISYALTLDTRTLGHCYISTCIYIYIYILAKAVLVRRSLIWLSPDLYLSVVLASTAVEPKPSEKYVSIDREPDGLHTGVGIPPTSSVGC